MWDWLHLDEVGCIIVTIPAAAVQAQQRRAGCCAWRRCAFCPFGAAVAHQVDQGIFAIDELQLAIAAAQVEIVRQVYCWQARAGSSTLEADQRVPVRRQRQRAEINCAPIFAVHVGIVQPPTHQRFWLVATIEKFDKVGVIVAAALAAVAVNLRQAHGAAGGSAISGPRGENGAFGSDQDQEEDQESQQTVACPRVQQAKHMLFTPQQR
jgi:hypothetical protein